MTLAGLWEETLATAMASPIIKGAISTGIALLLVGCVLVVLVCVTYMLKMFFRTHEGIDRAHRFLIYLLTMLGVVILLLGGVLGLILPIIPGLLLLLFALLLLRRHYKSTWVDRNIRWLQWKLRLKRSVRKAKKRIAGSRIAKILRRRRLRSKQRRQRGDRT